MEILRRTDLDPDPAAQFAAWFEAARASEAQRPDAMALATTTRDGAPSARMVLLKGTDPAGFVFYSSYDSRKGHELDANPQAALLFYWPVLGRQVRVEGRVERVSAQESDDYFDSRPLGSRLSAAVSEQSRPAASRRELEERVARLAAELGDDPVPRPKRWGGYRLAPAAYEFWQHRDDRLHDRFRYTVAGGAWVIERLQP